MQQYREIKARHPDTILFFRMGDFYEMFEDDAQLAARELGLTLTSRNNGGAAEVPLAGVPVKAATEYLRRLVAKGHRVAICEQVEDPKLAKGLVRRAVVETVTPGSVLAEDWLARERNNFLVACAPRGENTGVAALDVTTGEFIWESVLPADLPLALARFEPPEIVVPAGSRPPLAPDAVTVTEREAWEFDPELAREDLIRAYGLASLDGLGVEAGDGAALGAAGALLRYARELKPGGLPHLARPHLVRRGDVLPLDEMTRRNLELVEPLRPGAAGTTLLEVLDRTRTPMGARLLRRWTASATSSASRAAPPWGARRPGSWAPCAIRFSASPTATRPSTAWSGVSARRSSRRRPGSTCSPIWGRSWPARSWTAPHRSSGTATRSGPATIARSTSCATRATAARRTSPGCRRASASAPGSPRSRSASTRCSGTTSK